MSSPPVFIKGMAPPARRFANFGLLKMKRFPIKRPEALRSERPFGRALVIIEALPFATGPVYCGRPKRFPVDGEIKKRVGARLQSQRSASFSRIPSAGFLIYRVKTEALRFERWFKGGALRAGTAPPAVLICEGTSWLVKRFPERRRSGLGAKPPQRFAGAGRRKTKRSPGRPLGGKRFPVERPLQPQRFGTKKANRWGWLGVSPRDGSSPPPARGRNRYPAREFVPPRRRENRCRR